jgi:hypothetical protein
VTASSGAAALGNADAWTSYETGMCLQWVRGPCWGIGSLYGSAIEAWNGAKFKHPGDRHPPKGAPMFYKGGQYGHIVISRGDGELMRSTDCTSTGRVSNEDLDWIVTHWGRDYLGWTEDLNGVRLPLTTDTDDDEKEDDVPKYNHGIMNADTKIKANQWVLVKWGSVTGDGAMDEGSSGVKIGDSVYTSSLHATVTAPEGSTIRADVYEYESGAGDVPVEDNPGVESLATSGDTAIEYNHSGYVSEGRGLVYRITCTSDATLRVVDVVVLSWKR